MARPQKTNKETFHVFFSGIVVNDPFDISQVDISKHSRVKDLRLDKLGYGGYSARCPICQTVKPVGKINWGVNVALGITTCRAKKCLKTTSMVSGPEVVDVSSLIESVAHLIV